MEVVGPFVTHTVGHGLPCTRCGGATSDRNVSGICVKCNQAISGERMRDPVFRARLRERMEEVKARRSAEREVERLNPKPVVAAAVVGGEAEAGWNNLRLPKSWLPLPVVATRDAEIDWVHRNRAFVIGATSTGQPRFDWDQADSPAVSRGAVGLMQDAANYPKDFMALFHKSRAGGDEDAEAEKGTRWLVGEVRKMIETMGGEK